jgi:hypothetical protein
MTMERTPADIEALARAYKIAHAESPEYAAHLDAIAHQSGWDEASEAAAYHLQVESLQLKCFECPPSSCRGSIDVVNDMVYGSRRKEVALRRRLLRAGLSLFEPFPHAALKEAERKRRAARRRAHRPGQAAAIEPTPVARKNNSAPVADA